MRCRWIIAVAGCLFAAGAYNAVVAGQDDAKALPHFVGNWLAHTEDKPSKFVPDGGKRDVQQVIVWALKERFILGREFRPADGEKSLWLMTYDANTQSYPFWFFSNHGVLGGEWNGTWDDGQKTLSSKATDTPQGWTSHGANHFPDAKSNEMAVWMKDESGNLMFETNAKKARQPESAGEKTLAEWSKAAKQDVPHAAELKVLDRMVGDWDTTNHARVAVWTPEEKRWTSKLTRKWVLDGQFMQENSQDSTGEEGLSLTTFDPRIAAYRGWWFSSEGFTSKSEGSWTESTGTFVFKSDGDGKTTKATWKFKDKDHHDVTVVVTDGDGKVYFDTTWSASRRK